jgi:NAD(P)-dependent dehydrogenase (short-subunit alcohol dehydrogenase family)
MSGSRLCIITGVGPGTGAALARRFAQGGYTVAMLARTAERLQSLERELKTARGFVCDVSDPAAVSATLTEVRRDFGRVSVLIHNAVDGLFGTFREIDPAALERNFQVNVMGLLHLARNVADDMVSAGEGAIIATGNTSAWRGKPGFAGFAPTKAAQRILLESIARDLGPQGVHAAYLTIDAVIDVPWTRQRWPERPDTFFIKPDDIAAEVWHIAHQPRSAWSFNVEVRPFGESW